MRRADAGSVVRQRMLRLKKRKTILRRQSRLREMMLLAKHGHRETLPDTTEPSADTE